MEKKKYNYSEIFHSFQGEGKYTGTQTAWIRFFLCNLQCDGFGQKDPTDPSTYILPFQDFDVSTVDRVEDLPVWEYGCDSSYTWAKKFKHLAKSETALDIANTITDVCLENEYNPEGKFLHPSGQWTHMAFTGGEPMLNQEAMVEILQQFRLQNNIPHYVTVETNGTKPLKECHHLRTIITEGYPYGFNREWFWSVSPKLWSTSGEKEKKAIKPEVVAEYARASDCGQLKYVVNGTPESWEEVERHTAAFRKAGVDWDVYIMPVGATKEQQEGKQIADIAIEAIRRGYKVSGRLHCYIFGNQIGT